jgi:maltooligosyltrehalose trehalohydrolase
MTAIPSGRRLPVGADVSTGGTDFRVWCPTHERVELVLEESTPRVCPLKREAGGYFSAFVEKCRAGTRYRFRMDGGDAFPDPASCFQPGGVHGPSETVDPSQFEWTDSHWPGLVIENQVLYEMHVGTFTREGTWQAAIRDLPVLVDLGITAVEMMPVAEFTGRFGWGYDGTFWFAPSRLYGQPDDLRHFVNRAHTLGLGVILDVVYNHLGADGNYQGKFSPYYSGKETEWGGGLNYDDKNAGPVREFVLANARYWVQQFHMDGLRLDATQQIFDDSKEHIITAIARETRAARSAPVIVIGESEPNNTDLVRAPENGGCGLDGLWNDDFHHSAVVALTGHNPAYYSGFQGAPQEFISAVKYGPLYQGQLYFWQKKARGSSGLDLPPTSSIVFLENHDQVSNTIDGARLRERSNPGCLRALTALMLLSPGTPLLFQGEEFGASTPFRYFADLPDELREKVRDGRKEFLSQFPNLLSRGVPFFDPGDPAIFEGCKLQRAATLPLYKDLLQLRRADPAFHLQKRGGVDGAVLGPQCFVLRYLTGGAGDRLLIVNLGVDLYIPSPAEPLLAAPRRCGWEMRWSSEHPAYGGVGTASVENVDGWRIPGGSAVVLGTVKNG